MTEYHASSSLQGRDKLFSVMEYAADEVSRILGYSPLVVWGSSQSAPKPDQDRVWFYVVNSVISDRQVSLGRPKRFRVEGILLVAAFCPKKPETLFVKTQESIDCIRNNYRKQRVLRGLVVRDLSVEEVPPDDQWSRLDLNLQYQYDYAFAS